MVELSGGAPLSGTLQMLVPVRSIGQGRIGSGATVTMPKLSGGSGVFLSFNLELTRAFTRDGERLGYVTADCRDGKLKATSTMVFTDGSRYSQESIRACDSSRG